MNSPHPRPLRLRPLRLGTRGSPLALAQAGQIARQLNERCGRTTVLVTVTTPGDESTAPIDRLGTTGVFTTTLREALLRGTVDLVVHSGKDLPTATRARQAGNGRETREVGMERADRQQASRGPPWDRVCRGPAAVVDNRGVPAWSGPPETASQDRSAARVVLADDDVLLREGLASLLDRSGFDVVGQVGNGTELLALVRSVRPAHITQIDAPRSATPGNRNPRQAATCAPHYGQ